MMLATSAVRSTPLRVAARNIVRKTTTVGLDHKSLSDPLNHSGHDSIEIFTNSRSQRAASSSSSEAASSPIYVTLGASAATAAAAGSIAWYYHLFGQEVHAMTPAEEG